jgi:hypothetical protein
LALPDEEEDAALPGSQQEVRHRRLKAWLIHALIGDGIATNEAAAKILLALASEGTSKPLIERVKKLSRHPMANSDHSLTTSDESLTNSVYSLTNR